MAYVVHFGSLLTGRILGTLPWVSCRVSDSMRGSTGDITLAAGSRRWRDIQGPRDFWAVEWESNGGRRIVAAGPVWPTDADASHRIGGAGIGSVLDRRILADPSDPTGASWTWSGMDLGSIARQVVALAAPDLPLVLPEVRAGTRTRTYRGFDLATAGQRIRELTEVQHGPDVIFEPRLKADRISIEWAMVSGTEGVPKIRSDQSPIVLDATAPMQTVVGKVAASRMSGVMATRMFASGAGSEAGKVIASATDTYLTSRGWPRIDGVASCQDADLSDVQALADGTLASSARVPAAIKVNVRASWWWEQSPGLGRPVRIVLPAGYSDALVGPLDVTARLLEWSTDCGSEWVTLTLADTLTEI